MPDIKGGAIRPEVELLHDITRYLVSGQIASNNIQYSSAATFGTTAVDIVNQLIDPGFNVSLQELKVHFIQKFTNVKDAVGSLTYQWAMRSEFVDANGSINITGYANIGAALTAGIGSLSNAEGTLTGFIDVGSVPKVPIRIRLQATGLVASSMVGQLNGASFVQFKGIVIPGT